MKASASQTTRQLDEPRPNDLGAAKTISRGHVRSPPCTINMYILHVARLKNMFMSISGI